ncbi:ROK family protein [Actinospongicola halichondriae]|uniref:ROK family protein n=1 Tax=Actinospongicola halichondriae TaxID=3236844 RepID=UPI003D5B6EFB
MHSSDTEPRGPGARIGIDVGGTKLLGVVIDPARPATPLREVRSPTPEGTEALVSAVASLVDDLDPGGSAALGIGLPGLVDRSDRFRYGPNLPGVVDVDLGGLLRARLGRDVVADNDATCAAVAEFAFGAGVGHSDGVLLTIGTGIGAGIVVDGEIRRGRNGFAGEPGHMVVDPAGPRCPCGRRGCWERFASGSGLGRLGREAAVAERLGAAVALAGDAESVRGEHVVAAARAGDREAGLVLDEFAWWLALGIANLVDVLDPSIVVLGGGVMDAADVLIDRVDAALPAEVMGSGHRPIVPVVAAKAGERAGAVGAALIAARSV